jgi:hypothetical protein
VYSKEERSRLKQEFWTVFGQYLALNPSAEGLKINWINYKTGIKYLYFKMEVKENFASIAIEITNNDYGMRELIFEQFVSFRKLLETYLQEDWEWSLHAIDDNGKPISKIYICQSNVSIYAKEDWPKLISFFKPRIVALDAFWSDAKDVFDLFK